MKSTRRSLLGLIGLLIPAALVKAQQDEHTEIGAVAGQPHFHKFRPTGQRACALVQHDSGESTVMVTQAFEECEICGVLRFSGFKPA